MNPTAKFDIAVQQLLRAEGGYVNDPNDPGKETNFGISKRSYKDLDIKKLTVEDAKAIYKRDWWDKYKYYQINNQVIANNILILSVNIGSNPAHKLVQKGIASLGYNLNIDGILGVKSMQYINSIPQKTLLDAIRAQGIEYYKGIVIKNPKLKKYYTGWVNRLTLNC